MSTNTSKSQWLSYSGQATDEWSGGIATFSNGDIATAFSVSKSNGASSVIVQRLNTDGNVVWTLDTGADYAPGAGSVLVGADDNVYVTGGTKQGSTGESGKNDSDIFAVALSPTGQKLWYKNYGIGIHEIGSSAVLDGNGNILLEGRVSEVNDGYSFIKDVPNFYGAEFSGGWRGFQLRINPVDGTVTKAYTTGSGNSGGGPIAIDSSRNIAFVAGYTFGAVNGVDTVGNGDPNGANTYLIARNETTGAVLWTRMENWMRSNVVSQESENAIYFVDKGNLEKVNGSTGQTIWSKALTNTRYTLSPIAGGGILLSESESNGALTIRRFDPNGIETGSQVISHTGILYPRAFIEKGDGTIQISGSTSGTITVDEETTVVNPKQAGRDAFVLTTNSAFSLPPEVTTPVVRGNSLYTVVPGPSWTEAEAQSAILGGHLAAIGSVEENNFIIDQFNTLIVGDPKTYYKWIGFTDSVQEGVWRWTNGEATSFTNWSGPNPDNNTDWTSPTGQDYAAIHWYGGAFAGDWDDKSDLSQYFSAQGVAEIPLTSSINFSDTPTEGAGLFTTSIYLSAGTEASGNLAESATVYWKVTGVDSDDLASGQLSGSGTITNGKLDLEHSLKSDSDTGENFEVSVFSDAEMTQQIGTIGSVVVLEAIASPLTPVIRGNSLYTIVDGPSWTQAEANSVKLGGHLATINNLEEYKWAAHSFWTLEILNGMAFIGLNDAKQEGTYEWASGQLTEWHDLSDLVIAQNWYSQQQHFGGWDYGIISPGSNWEEIGSDERYVPYQDRGTVILMDNSASFYASNGSAIFGAAEIPFIRRGDSAYVIVQGPTWEEAEANAVALGGHLVTINDAEENEWVASIISDLPDYGVYIGATDKENEGAWKDSEGNALAYANWNVGEPNGFTSENYAMMYPGVWSGTAEYYGKWNDTTNINEVTKGIAEIKLAPNNNPAGTPTISGDFKAGQVITIDKTPIQDADNFDGWTPTYKYTWEVANDPGLTQVMPVWETLNTADATDGDENLEITDDLTGKLIRGVVSYVDGYGTNETVYSSEAKVEASVPTQRLISLPTDLTAKVGQIIEVPITINQARDLQALDLNFAFDPALFSVPTSGGLVRAGSLTSSWTFSGNVNTSTNTLKVSGFSSESLSAVSGDLAYLRLQVKGTAPRGEAVLDLISASLNENELSVELQDGSLTITAPKVSITSDLKAPVGGSIGIPITIDDASDLQSIDLVFAYDPTIFSLPTSGEIVSGSTLTGDWSFAANTATPGRIKISGYGTTPLEGGEGGLVNLNLKINSGIDTGSVLLDLVSASFNEGAITADLIDGTLELLPPTFQVMDVRQTASGLALKLSEAPDLEKLNLYDGQDASVDLPDLRLTRNDGTAVEDLSLHWKAETSELYVIHTDSLTGISQNQFAAGASPFQSDLLAAGDYTLVIDARNDGLVSASSGELIDGNGDGITGDAFSYSFTKSTPSNLISIGDTARGSGQSLGLNGIANANGINGLPVLVSTSAAIRSLRGTVTYDATAFNNASLVVGRDLPDDWTLETQEDVIGSLNYTASGTTAITGTDQELFRFDAVVSQDAPYGASTLIEATVEAPEDPTLTFGSDPSLVALAYSGDTTGNGGHSSLDASRIQRVVVGLDSGFDPYDTLAPTLIGDTTGNGGLSSLDASRVQQEVVGLTVDSFPGLPASIV